MSYECYQHSYLLSDQRHSITIDLNRLCSQRQAPIDKFDPSSRQIYDLEIGVAGHKSSPYEFGSEVMRLFRLYDRLAGHNQYGLLRSGSDNHIMFDADGFLELGRSTQPDIEAVFSRKQAQLFVDGSKCLSVRDLGSTNATLIKAQTYDKESPIIELF